MTSGLRQRLGIDVPLIQAPMAGVQGFELAAAVSEAGALGSLPSATFSPAQLCEELQALRAATARPWAVNFFCHRAPAQDDGAAEQRWIDALAPWYAEAGAAAPRPAGAARAPFSAALAEVVEPFRPPVVSFHFGLPAPDVLQRVRGWGSVVLSSATTVEEGLWLQAQGVDAVIAQGLEAGGHRGHFLRDDHDLSGQLPTLALLQQLVAQLRVPVIAAGGLADAQAVAAALAHGAAAVQVGTAFLCCHEARTSALHRQALGAPRPTAITAAFTGRPARGIVNRWIEDSARLTGVIPPFPLAAGALAPLRAAAEARGQADFTALWAGIRTASCRAAPAATIVHSLAAGWRHPEISP
jgi:nitronate monooxygenase